MKRPSCFAARLFGVGVDIVGDAVDQRMLQTFGHWALAPGKVGGLLLRAAAFEPVRCFQQPVRRVRPPVEDNVLAKFAQFRVQVVIHAKLASIHDAHVHAGLDRVVQEDRVHRLPDRLVAAEGEGKVGDAARDMHMRQPGADTARGLDEGDAVIVMLLDARRDREDVRVEDDVLGREADALCEKLIGALADRKFALRRLGLPAFVERHHDDGRAIAQEFCGPASRNGSSPSFMLMELTIALPCTHLRPASITAHFDESIITGTREMSGSEAMRLRKVVMAFSESSRPSSMFTSSTFAPLSTCSRATARAAS